MGALLSKFIPWVRSGHVEDDITTSSEADTISIDSTDSLITFTQNPPPVHRKTSKESKGMMIDVLPVDLLLRYYYTQ